MKEKQTIQPPEFARTFFNWYCDSRYIEDLLGDLDEEFSSIAESKPSSAKWWYIWQILLLFKPRFIKSLFPRSITQHIMLQNHIKIGFRSIWKHKSNAIINIVGLSIGMACFILISLYITDELSYDRHFSNAEQIYRVTVKNYNREGTISRQWAFASAGHSDRLKEDYAAITHSTRFYCWAFPDIQFGDKQLPGEQVIFTDDDVFDIFDFKFIQGDPTTALNDIYSLVLTRESASRIFGNDWEEQEVIGQSVDLSRNGMKAPFKITGVMEDMPDQQHFHFEYLAPIRFVEQIFGENTMNNVGGNYNWLTYVKLSEGSSAEALTHTINDEFWDKYMGTFDSGIEARDYYDFDFQPLTDIHLHSNLEGELEANGSMQQVTVFGIVGILLLLTAIVNYMNLSTSQYSRRMKEVGVRKVVGAFKRSLVNQFLVESLMITVFALPLALVAVWMVLPDLNGFVEKQLTFNLMANLPLVGFLLGLLALVGLIAGLYPALFLSKVNTTIALKGEQVMRASNWNFRSFLVTFQYSIVIGLIFSLIVIEGQLNFIRNTDPGYQKDQLVRLSITRNMQNLDVFKDELLSHPGISDVGYSSRIPTGRLADSWGAAFYQGDSLAPTNFRLPFIATDDRFITTFDIPLIAGENFKKSQDMAEDSIGYYLINRKASEALGFSNPADAVGQPLAYGPFDNTRFKIGRILGVTEDFHFESMHSKIAPMLMMKMDNRYRNAVIKISASNVTDALEHIESTFAAFEPVYPANYQFVDELFAQQYQQEERLSMMIRIFTGIAIFIGCLGLIGMVGFIIETRTKEIGIRKVLGASGQSILILIGNRFFILMMIAFTLIMPISYWLLNGWLENFVYRTDIGLLMWITPLFGALILTTLSTIYQTLKAAHVNPVYCLKDE